MTDQFSRDADAALDDLCVVERTDRPRSLVGLPGHYHLQGWVDSKGRSRRFPCEVIKISPEAIKFSAPVLGSVGVWAEVQFEHLGRFSGPVLQAANRAMMMKIVGTHEDRAKVASKLAWVSNTQKPETRRYPRLVPGTSESSLALQGGVVTSCEIIDYSVGGVALYSDLNPALGTVVKVGNVLGRVVRQFGGGFAVSFFKLQDSQTIENAVVQPMPTAPPS